MNILSFKPGHDGHISYIKDGNLEFSIEAEKDSGPRYGEAGPNLFIRALQYLDDLPDVLAVGGWVDVHRRPPKEVGGGYHGICEKSIINFSQKFAGKDMSFFSSSHERSHLLCSYGLSPFPQGVPCYALVWEGAFGSFYKINEKVEIKKIGEVLHAPGAKYRFLYALANPSCPDDSNGKIEDAGKLMALAGYGCPRPPAGEEVDIINYIFSREHKVGEMWKKDLKNTSYYNIGVESDRFKEFARVFSDALFARFLKFAQENLDEGLPLLISGGCGLNCDWNSEWKRCGLFSDVFVPPCTNDSGSAIGTGIDALHYHTGVAKIGWDVYAGENFIIDSSDMSGVEKKALDIKEVAEFLSKGNIVAWVQGRYEIGPRALGNRSIIAMPFSKEIHQRLNTIKAREGFRPIAPICLEEDMDSLFYHHGPSPHMLYFQRVLTSDLPAVTHVDGSARTQSVNKQQNPQMYDLLCAFKQRTGFGVLCNTSLNFNGTGFINRMSDLLSYCRSRSLDGFVVNENFYRFTNGG